MSGYKRGDCLKSTYNMKHKCVKCDKLMLQGEMLLKWTHKRWQHLYCAKPHPDLSSLSKELLKDYLDEREDFETALEEATTREQNNSVTAKAMLALIILTLTAKGYLEWNLSH